jgi:hypothetical protein
MKEHLVKLLKNWNQKDADSFHSHCERDSIEGRYLWFYDETGTTIYRDITAVHISNSGKCCKLTESNWKQDEWSAFLQLYELSQNEKSFRIEIPITSSITEDNFFYSEVQRPAYQIGLDFQYDLFEKNLNEDYFVQYIDQTVILFKNLKKVISSLDGIGFPMVGIPPTKRLRDKDGYFWSDFKKWNLNEQEFRDRMKNDLNVTFFYIENNLGALPYVQVIKKYAEEQWNTVQ